MMGKFIRFDKDGEHDGKPLYRIVNRRAGDELGRVLWHKPWRLWAAHFDDCAVWSADCLKDVQSFIENVNDADAHGAEVEDISEPKEIGR